MLARQVSVEAMVQSAGVRPILFQRLIELGLVTPRLYYTASDRRELRRICRLIDDVGLEAEAVEVLLRMRRRILALQQQVAQLQVELRSRPLREADEDWVEAEWLERS